MKSTLPVSQILTDSSTCHRRNSFDTDILDAVGRTVVDVISQEKQETPGLTLYSECPF